MGTKSKKHVNWEPDVRKGLDHIRNIKQIKSDLKSGWDHTKIEGYNKPY